MAQRQQSSWDEAHLLQLEGMSKADITGLLDDAEGLRSVANGDLPALDVLRGKTVVNLFLEDSTRTRSSFSLAIKRLGGDVLEFSSAGSSISKGESVLDTARNIEAMGVHGFVVRAAGSGVPEFLARNLHTPVINAGDGKHEHPTQGLLDLLTLRQYLDELTGKTIGIVGDIASSRVARSAIHGLTTLGANVILSGPPTLVPRSLERIVEAQEGRGEVRVVHDLDEVIGELDAIMMLRVQFERHGGDAAKGAGVVMAGAIASDYKQMFGLTRERAKRLGPQVPVLHPGPINLGLEVDVEVAEDEDRSVILQQVTNGVAVRMAALKRVIGGK